MAKTQNKSKKQKPTKTPTKKILKKTKTKTKANKPEEPQSTASIPKTEQPTTSTATTDSDSDFDSDSTILPKLLEAYSKDQLIDLICTSALKNPSLYSLIRSAAVRDVTHRKIFVHGFGWDTTRESLASVFQSFGEIEDCKVVTDKITGKAKGYGFVIFKTRKGAKKALKDPRKKINNRIASCQLASVGPVGVEKDQDLGSRRIYVSNLQKDADANRLRVFFEKFGDIETGPIGFDVNTRRSRGYAIFVYKTVEGAKKALEEPYKVFEGNQLQCQKAADGKNKNNPVQAVTQGQMVQGQWQGQQSNEQLLAAVAAAQSMALFGQHPGLNPVYGGLLGNPAAAGSDVVGFVNPVLAGALNQGALNSGVVSQGLVPRSQVSAMGSLGGGSQSVLGAYGGGQGLQLVYPNAQIGQAGASRGHGAVGSFAGYPSYMCLI